MAGFILKQQVSIKKTDKKSAIICGICGTLSSIFSCNQQRRNKVHLHVKTENRNNWHILGSSRVTNYNKPIIYPEINTMPFKKVTFKNNAGELLSGRLDLPLTGDAHNYAIFAHCFTCTKNLLAVTYISTALTQAGFGVLRFDFTGLGESEGDFSDTNFSGNVEDLEAAHAFLTSNYKAPTLLIGHSLGGAAALLAADRMKAVQAVVSIAAPSEPSHVLRLLKNTLDEIKTKGKATVVLEGREFTIKQQFVQDLMDHSLTDTISRMRKPLLIFHSPQDRIVGIENAEAIFRAAFHPKSFITLDGADHLLTNKQDSQYVGSVIAAWAKRYIQIPGSESLKSNSRVAASLDGDAGFTTQMKLGNHGFTADEPVSVGGADSGPSPYEYLAGALAACTAMTIQMYAHRKGWAVENVTVHIDHNRTHAADCEACEQADAKIDYFTKSVDLSGNLSDEQKRRLLEIGERCPVHKTLLSNLQIQSALTNPTANHS